jgi:DNA-binding FadR family transcriptional regulator
MLPRRLVEARRVVEVGVAELAVQRCDDGHLELLTTFLDRMRDAHERGEVERFAESDIAFHHTLFEAVGNVYLDALFEPLSEVLHRLRTRTSSVHDIREHAISWHAKILDAAVARDAAGARAAMHGHLVQTEDDLMSYLGGEPLQVSESGAAG